MSMCSDSKTWVRAPSKTPSTEQASSEHVLGPIPSIWLWAPFPNLKSRLCVDTSWCVRLMRWKPYRIHLMVMYLYTISLIWKNHTRVIGQQILNSHSLEIRGLCLMKCSSKTLQTLPYFWNTKTQVVFHFVLLNLFPLMNALVFVNKHQSIH